MFVRAVLAQGSKPSALLAPQQGVTRSPAGEATAMIVDAQGRAQTRVIQTSGMVGDSWLVSGGLKPGDRMIVEGLQRVRPGVPVRVVPAGSPPQSPPAGSPGQAIGR
jgi:membrane fusion protein (multidrug efflux system)